MGHCVERLVVVDSQVDLLRFGVLGDLAFYILFPLDYRMSCWFRSGTAIQVHLSIALGTVLAHSKL